MTLKKKKQILKLSKNHVKPNMSVKLVSKSLILLVIYARYIILLFNLSKLDETIAPIRNSYTLTDRKL